MNTRRAFYFEFNRFCSNAQTCGCDNHGGSTGRCVRHDELVESLKSGIDGIKSRGESVADFESGMLEAFDYTLASVGAARQRCS